MLNSRTYVLAALAVVCLFFVICGIVLIDFIQNPLDFPTQPSPQLLTGNYISPLTLVEGREIFFGAGYCLYRLDVQNQILHVVNCTTDWKFRRPVTDGKRVYAAIETSPGSAQFYVAIDLVTSEVIWRNAETISKPYWWLKDNHFLVNDKLYVPDRERIYVLDTQSGRRIWQTNHNWIGGPIPFITNGDWLWYPIARDDVFSTDGALAAVDLRTGEIQQTMNLLPEIQFDQLLYIDDKRIVALDKDKNVHPKIFAVDRLKSNQLLWSIEIARGGQWVNQVFSLDNLLVFEWHNTIHALDLDTGQEHWLFRPDSKLATKSSSDKILVFRLDATDASIYALDANSGDLVWKYLLKSDDYTLPVVTDEVVYIGNRDTIDALNKKTGQVLWQIGVESQYKYYRQDQFP